MRTDPPPPPPVPRRLRLNCLACIGWSTINTIVGASALKAVSSTHELPEPAGIVIIAIITLAVALFGYRYVHMIERYSSVPVFIIFIIMLGQAGRFMHGGYGGVGEAEAASVLSFGGTIAGFSLGWTSLAADYTVYQRADTANWKIFLATYVGLNVPLVFVESLGALMMSTLDVKETWAAVARNADGSTNLGGLLGAPLIGRASRRSSFSTVMWLTFPSCVQPWAVSVASSSSSSRCRSLPTTSPCVPDSTLPFPTVSS